ncbi:MAG: hypothetical protein MUF31_02860 [Akkermansiaceae bacterium]|jgi:hypothetical protein|nr:hypothetical protein [Akkermansiaceae bacterium]
MSTPSGKARSASIFQIACWMLGLLAFTQLIIGGIALALRVEAAREVRIEEKIVTRIVNVAPPAPAPAPAPPIVALPPAPDPVLPDEALPPPRPLRAPAIADPVVERLVAEAREARVAEDMGAAIIKLEEARRREPNEPNTLYELGLVYEAMAGFDLSLADKAAEAYLQVTQLGTDAGALYQLAARKLEEGIARPADMRGKLALGRVRVFNDDHFNAGERVILTVPVTAAPGEEPSASDFVVSVLPFDKTPDGRTHTYGPDSTIENRWVSGAIDWVGGEEFLSTTYIIPKAREQDAYLLGQRKYYGYVIQLFYKNELIDVAAYPRHLTSEAATPETTAEDPLFLEQDMLPRDFDPSNPLLPGIDQLPPLEPGGDLPPLEPGNDLPPLPEP